MNLLDVFTDYTLRNIALGSAILGMVGNAAHQLRMRILRNDRPAMPRGETGERRGSLVLVVGPSGAGKDTLIDAGRERFRGDARFVFPLRCITRPVGAPGERHIAISTSAFAEAEAAGSFLLAWRSHGLAYAIPAHVQDDIAAGRIVIVNVSRGVIAEAERLVSNVAVLHVTASAEVRALRIRGRRRESDDAIAGRLERSVDVVTARAPVVTIDNGGALEDAVASFTEALQQIASRRPAETGQ